MYTLLIKLNRKIDISRFWTLVLTKRLCFACCVRCHEDQ